MSDHIPDAGKMVSDTPRTDAAHIGMGIVFREFAQQLERELNAANEHIKRLEEAGDAHMEWVPVSFQSAWRAAKEANP